ncbi:beta-glucan synthesis-associated [Flagelloscypha sp. PMI_526]|nr:beta-glucan synthesis-associated [Flagelloscypha sp. PMI_526]
MSSPASRSSEHLPLSAPSYQDNSHSSPKVSSPLNPLSPSFGPPSSGHSTPNPDSQQRGSAVPVVVNPFARPNKTSQTRPDASLASRSTWTAPRTPSFEAQGFDLEYPGLGFRGSRPSSSMSSSTNFNSASNRGSMVLYRLASEEEGSTSALVPPRLGSGHMQRSSVFSTSGDSTYSLDDKYGGATPTTRGMVAYEYDPSSDMEGPMDEEDEVHDPASKTLYFTRRGRREGSGFGLRAFANVGALLFLTIGLLMLFIFWPVWDAIVHLDYNLLITDNAHVNGTGQAPEFFSMPTVIDKDTPASAKTRTGFDGQDYVLVFSDEFERDGRTFYPGDDPYWEAVDLWYGATADMEWYDPRQVTTRDGNLVITIDSTSTTQPNLTPNSSAPFTAENNHDLTYRSGMLQSWNKLCFTTGYIEVAVILPGPDQESKGYWPGIWTMGNLGRPGYLASTDGMWPYTYDTCDVGTFPNQTNKDGQTPAAAIHSDASRENYNFALSWLPGQRASACSCPADGLLHPGPVNTKGRGAPEIDIFEAEHDKSEPTGHVISQSSQFAPFSHDYVRDTANDASYHIYDTGKTRENTYKGSAVQQAVSSISKLPADGFWGQTNRRHVVYGFEYWSNPQKRDEGFITWVSDGKADVTAHQSVLGPDPEAGGGSGVGQRLISEEPMSIVLNVGLSQNWQPVDPATMVFPTEMLVDYVRVYQRKGHENVGCDPKDYPTMDYIEKWKPYYSDATKTKWEGDKPVNSLYAGSC